jgi:hypothetical protein
LLCAVLVLLVSVAGENSRSKERQYGTHPSMKPLKICERLIAVHSNVGETVLVPFGGSGSEVVAAAAAGRGVITYETEKEYYEIVLRRLHAKGYLPPQYDPPPPLKQKEEEEEAAREAAAREAAEAEEADQAGGGGGAVDPASYHSLSYVGGMGSGGSGGGASAELLRDARYASGYMGVYKLGKRWVAKVRPAQEHTATRPTARDSAGLDWAACGALVLPRPPHSVTTTVHPRLQPCAVTLTTVARATVAGDA